MDYFKHYNDTYGHAEGDYVLKEVARTIKENIRNEDRVFCYGGEEFAIILHRQEARSQSVCVLGIFYHQLLSNDKVL
jgi:diguanylate cyclase (GGDEF)-like protein